MLRALLFVSLLAAPSLALAQDARVVLVAVDDGLLTASESALAPWGVEVVRVDGATPASMPLASDVGASVAREHRATVVVWVSTGEGGPALWVYDAVAERTLARALPSAPPFDEPTSAAIALTLKTLLRQSEAAPPAERVVEPPSPGASPTPHSFEIEIGGGLASFATEPVDAEPRFSLAASYWPTEVGAILGVAIGARAGTGIGVHTAETNGRWTSTQAAVGLRLRGVLDPFDVGGGIEAGVSITTLDVTLASAARASLIRVALAGAMWGEVGVRPSPEVRVALRAGATVALPYERYLERGVLVLDVSPVAMIAELLVALRFG